MQCREAIVLGLVDGRAEGEVGQDEAYGAHVAPQGRVVEGIEAIVVGDSVVGLALNEKLDYVISLLGDGIMKWCVSL